MEIGRVGSERKRPPYWNIRLREANSSSGIERDRDWQNGCLATRESFSDLVQFDRLSRILSIEIKKGCNTIVFKEREI